MGVCFVLSVQLSVYNTNPLRRKNKMQRKSLIAVLLVAMVLLLISCSSLQLDKPNVIDSSNTTARFSRSLLKAAQFLNGGTSETESDSSTLPAKDDEVYVTVKLGSGIVDSYFGSGFTSVADYALSKEGEAMISDFTAQQDSVIALMRDKKLTTEIKHRYNILQNGFAAKIKFGDIETVKALPGVKQVVLAEEYSIPEVSSKALAASFADTGIFNNPTNYAGAGTVIAILDTGIYADHSAFATAPSVEAINYEYVEKILSVTNAGAVGATAETAYYSAKIPFAFNYADGNERFQPGYSDMSVGHEHGTHVAGIAAGNDDTIKGAAWDAQLAVMRVFGAGKQGANDTDIYAAVEDCVILGVQVANLSLGSTCGFAYEKAEQNQFVNDIVNLARKAGLTMCCATGNVGTAWWDSDTLAPFSAVDDPDNGTVSSPASFPSTFAVGSANNLVKIYVNFEGSRIIGRNGVVDSETSKEINFFAILDGKDEATFEYVAVPGAGAPEDYDGLDVTGKIALVQRGEISFAEKVQNAKDKGAIACILYDNVTEKIEKFGAVVGENTIPTMTITLEDGTTLANAQDKRITIGSSDYFVEYSYFSSMGALNDLSIGVDILGIGAGVYSAVPQYYDWQFGTNGYTYMDGTSMATPNVAGVMAALKGYLKQAYPTKTPAEISNLAMQRLMSTATILENSDGNPITPRRQGSGLADIERAIETDAYITVTGSDRTKLNLGSDTEKDGIYTLNFNVVNDGENALGYKLNVLTFTESAVTGKSINYTLKGADKLMIAEKAYMLDGAEVKYYVNGTLLEGDEITVEAGEKLKIKAVITLTEENKAYMNETFPNGIYVEGFAVLESTDEEGIDLHIPYISFYGDWMTLPAYEPTASDGTASTFGKYFGLTFMSYEDAGNGWFVGQEIQAGVYSYTLPEGYKAPTANADKAAIGRGVDDNGSLDGTVILKAINLAIKRNASSVYLSYTKVGTGESLGNDVFYNIGKACAGTNGGYSLTFNEFYPETLMLANNEQLLFSFTYDFNDKPVGQVVDMPVFIDLEAPTLEKASWRTEDGRTYLDLTVYDNHYLQATGLLTYGTEDSYNSLYKFMFPCYGDVRNGDYSYSIDVTDYMANVVNDTFAVQLVDYARNVSVYEIELPDSGENNANAVITGNENRTLAVRYRTDDAVIYYDVNDPSYTEVHTYSSFDSSKANNAVVNSESEGTDEFVIENGVLKAYNGEGGEVVIPDGVTSIGAYVFNGDSRITKLVLPEGLKSIGYYSIRNLYHLTEIVLPKSLERMEYYSFCTLPLLTSLDLENTSLNYAAFALNGIAGVKTLTFPKTETPLTLNFTLDVCYNLEKVTFLGDVASIHSSFMFNDSLKEIEFMGNVTSLEGVRAGMALSLTGCDVLERIVFHGNVDKLGYCIVQDYGDYVYKDYSQAASALIGLKEVIFEKDVGSIDGISFSGCPKLENVAFGGNVGYIGSGAFGGSDMLYGGFTVLEGNDKLIKDETGIVYNADKTAMFKPSAWDYDGVLELPETITELNEREFSIPEFVPEYVKQDYGIYPEGENGGGYYWNLNSMFGNPDYDKTLLKGVKLGSQIKTLPAYCFYRNYNLAEINLENVEVFKTQSLSGTAITSFRTTENTKKIGAGVWKGCRNLTEIVIGENVEVETYEEFYSGTGFVEIEVPEYITADAAYLFAACKNLEKVTFLNTGSQNIGSGAFSGTTSLKEIIGIDNVTAIGEYAFNLSGITHLELENVKSISGPAFYHAEKIESVYFPALETVEPIYDWDGELYNAFAYCTSLKSFYIGENCGYFNPVGMFEGCDALEEIVVHENNRVFSSIEGILFNKAETAILLYPTASTATELELPDTIKAINAGTFMGAPNLEKVVMPAVETIGANAFAYSAVKEVVVSDALVEIGLGAFRNTAISEFDLSDVLVIDDDAFYATKLTEVTVNKAEYLGNKAFGAIETLEKVTIGGVDEFNFSRVFFGSTNISSVELNGCEVLTEFEDGLYNADKTVLYRYFGTEANVTLPEGIVKIDSHAFAGNTTVKNVVLPASLGYIADGAFYGCTALTEITFKSEKAPVLQNYYRDGVRYLYNQFVNDLEEADGNEDVKIYVSGDASYNTYIWRTYFKNIIVK